MPDSKEFYPGLERTLLQALIHAEGVEGRYSLAHVYRVLGDGVAGLKAYVEVRPYLQVELKTLLEMRQDQLAGILNGARNRLSIWLDPGLAAATEPGPMEVPWAKVFSEPSLVYIGVPQELIGDNASGYVLLKLLKRIVDLKTLQFANRNGGRLPLPVSVYWDEFPNFGYLPGIKENLGTMRSRRVAYHIAVQNTDQGRAVYGDEEWEAIEGTFAQRVYFLSGLSDNDAQRLSQVLGETSVMQEVRGVSRRGVLPIPTSRTVGEREVARPLLSPEEMRTAPKGEAVVLLEGMPPARMTLFGMWRKDHLLHRLWKKAREARAGEAGFPLPRERGPVSLPASASPEGEPAPWSRDPSRPESLLLYLEALTRWVPEFKRHYQARRPFAWTSASPRASPPPSPPGSSWGGARWRGSRAPLPHPQGLEAIQGADRAGYWALVRWCRVVEWWKKVHREEPVPEVLTLPKEEAERVLMERLCGEAVEVRDAEVLVRPGLGLAGLLCPRPGNVHPGGGGGGVAAGHRGGPGAGGGPGPEAPGGGPEGGDGEGRGEGVPAHHG